MARTKSASWIQETNWSPDPALPPSPVRTSRERIENAPPRSGLMIMALRRAIFRVRGVAAAKNSRSQLDATSMLKRQAEGASGSLLRLEEHTSELQSPDHLVCRLLLEK